jgi:hypothetical protein
LRLKALALLALVHLRLKVLGLALLALVHLLLKDWVV